MSLKIIRRLLPDWGTTYGPPGEGPFPTVMILHGSEGGWSGWSHRLAVIFAAHGYLAFPLIYSSGGNGWNAGSIKDVSLDRTVQALAALRAFPFAGPKLGLYGVSRGAEHALLVSTLMATEGLSGADAIAVLAPPDVVCGAFDAAYWRDSGDPGWRAWDPSQRAWTWKGSSENLLPTTPIAAEQITAPIFIAHGTADKVWSVEMSRRLEQRLIAAGRSPEVHYFEGKDHTLDSASENDMHEKLLAFFERTLID
jgi:dipeptidyl aminopeptidase/acylaminoacyl peptidase